MGKRFGRTCLGAREFVPRMKQRALPGPSGKSTKRNSDKLQPTIPFRFWSRRHHNIRSTNDKRVQARTGPLKTEKTIHNYLSNRANPATALRKSLQLKQILKPVINIGPYKYGITAKILRRSRNNSEPENASLISFLPRFLKYALRYSSLVLLTLYPQI
jgi:hypothetical protein